MDQLISSKGAGSGLSDRAAFTRGALNYYLPLQSPTRSVRSAEEQPGGRNEETRAEAAEEAEELRTWLGIGVPDRVSTLHAPAHCEPVSTRESAEHPAFSPGICDRFPVTICPSVPGLWAVDGRLVTNTRPETGFRVHQRRVSAHDVPRGRIVTGIWSESGPSPVIVTVSLLSPTR